jgi:outer membrane immunogenic protein
MNARGLTALLTLIALTPYAASADGPPPPPPLPPAPGCCAPFVWTGVYLGIQAGATWGEPRWTFPVVESFNTAPGQNFPISESGVSFGGHLGYNYQINNIVLGAEISYADSSEEGRVRGPIAAFPLDSYKVSAQDLFTAVTRLGFAHDQFLFYGKAGYANSGVDLGAGSGLGVTAHASQRESGWIVGTGFDARMIGNLLFGVEYDFVDLPGGHFTSATGGTAPGLPFNANIGSAQVQTIMARFSILFGPTACCGEGLLGKY